METSKDVDAGIECIHRLFISGRLKINKECRHLINELESYRYADKKDSQNEKEEPIKENDHALDALRYVLYNQERLSQDDVFFETIKNTDW